MVCHALLQWTTFCETSPAWPARLGCPHRAWLSFIELDKAVVRVIRLASFLWVWFQCVCPLMPSRNTYCLTWVSLTLDMWYLFMAAPAKCSHCSLQWIYSTHQIGKGVCQGCILSPCLFNLYAWEMLDWKKHKLESRLLGEISISLNMQMTPPSWQKLKRN